jgi:hypothetical protein
MPVNPPEYETFLHPGDAINVGIDLPDKKFAEHPAIIVTGESSEILLKLCSCGIPSLRSTHGGSKVFISRGEGDALFQCSARLKEQLPNDLLKIELPEKVALRERRKHLRADVKIPVRYALPSGQDMDTVTAEWENGQVGWEENKADAAVLANCRDSRVNLSGSGLRFKMRDCFSCGTLLHLEIELPGTAPERIHAVGSIVRTTDLVPEMSHIDYYSTAMTFQMIDGRDRHKIMKFVLAERQKSPAPPHHGHL